MRWKKKLQMSDHGIVKKKRRGGRAHTNLQHYYCFMFVICPTNTWNGSPPLMAAAAARTATVPIWRGFLVVFLILVCSHARDPPADCGFDELEQGRRERGSTVGHGAMAADAMGRGVTVRQWSRDNRIDAVNWREQKSRFL